MNTQLHIRRLFLAGCLATTLACGLPAVTQADTPNAYKSITVLYDDLNLSAEAGVACLYSRIRWAAKNVCRGSGGLSPMELHSRQFARCKAEAIDAAVKKVNNRILTAMHDKQSNRRFG